MMCLCEHFKIIREQGGTTSNKQHNYPLNQQMPACLAQLFNYRVSSYPPHLQSFLAKCQVQETFVTKMKFIHFMKGNSSVNNFLSLIFFRMKQLETKNFFNLKFCLNNFWKFSIVSRVLKCFLPPFSLCLRAAILVQ